MAQRDAKIRLFVDEPLASGATVALTKGQAHYLASVMRRAVGDAVLVFNGQDGEWRADIAALDRRGGHLESHEQTRTQTPLPDLWLAFAPVKKARTDFIVEKACELGCPRIIPVFTRHTNSERVRTDRLRDHAIEAAEQCGLLSVPEIAQPVTLDALLDGWDPARRLLFCDERGAGAPVTQVLRTEGPGPWAIITGPEGGFAPAEADRLAALDYAHPASLGPRILRADTAAVAALTLWQATLGDWQ